MSKILEKLLLDFLEGLVGDFVDGALLDLAEKPFAIEERMSNLGIAQFDNIFTMFASIGITLIVVKFLIKGFNMYVLWTDGDADADPAQLVINFVKAMIMALTFTYLYAWFAELIINLIDDTLSAIGLFENQEFSDLAGIIIDLSQLGFAIVVGVVIFAILYVVLYIKLIAMGFEILVLRVGAPLACVGLMDADGGVFKSYAQKFIQVSITILVQVTLMKVALSLMLARHFIWGIAGAYFAITTPKFIREFVVFSGGGGITNTIYSGARLAQMARRMIK